LNIPSLCERKPRLALVKEISERERFLHWELEFADLFDDRGGFDLILGNPPWIKMEWNEQSVLSDVDPEFIIKDLTATETSKRRAKALNFQTTRDLYFSEYEKHTGTKNYLNATQNYPDLKGQQTNLYKLFLPQAFQFTNINGVSGFLHPSGVYNDPNGGLLRKKIYQRLRTRFSFSNELKFFPEVGHNLNFVLNVYGPPHKEPKFDSISKLYDINTIQQCYEICIQDTLTGLKDNYVNWNI
jgi:hypothetical protein